MSDVAFPSLLSSHLGVLESVHEGGLAFGAAGRRPKYSTTGGPSVHATTCEREVPCVQAHAEGVHMEHHWHAGSSSSPMRAWLQRPQTQTGGGWPVGLRRSSPACELESACVHLWRLETPFTSQAGRRDSAWHRKCSQKNNINNPLQSDSNGSECKYTSSRCDNPNPSKNRPRV